MKTIALLFLIFELIYPLAATAKQDASELPLYISWIHQNSTLDINGNDSHGGYKIYYSAFPDSEVYHLTDKTNGILFELWSKKRLNSFCLIEDTTNQKCYLSWLDGNLLCVSEVVRQSQPFPRMVADLPSSWQADNVIDLSQFENWNTYFYSKDSVASLIVTSVVCGKNQDTVLFANNANGKEFKMVKGNGRWHCYDGNTEIEQNQILHGIDEKFLENPNVSLVLGVFTNISATIVLKTYKVGWVPVGCVCIVESTNYDINLSQDIWMDIGQYCFQNNTLVECGGNSLLSWIDYRADAFRLCLVKIEASRSVIQQGRDPTVGILTYHSNDPYIRGKVDHIIDLRQFENWQRFFKGGGGVASASEQNNVLTLNVTNAAGSKFKFSNQDGQWHAYSFWGEISRVKKPNGNP